MRRGSNKVASCGEVHLHENPEGPQELNVLGYELLGVRSGIGDKRCKQNKVIFVFSNIVAA